jgi:hypothetical protein
VVKKAIPDAQYIAVENVPPNDSAPLVENTS